MVHLASFPLLVSSSVLEITLNYELTQQQRYSAAPEINYELNYGSGYLGGVNGVKWGYSSRNRSWKREVSLGAEPRHAAPRRAALFIDLAAASSRRRAPLHPQVSGTSAPPAGGAWDVHHPETRLSSILSASTGRFLSLEPYISLFVIMYNNDTLTNNGANKANNALNQKYVFKSV